MGKVTDLWTEHISKLDLESSGFFSLSLKADLVCLRAGTTWVEWGSLGVWAVPAPVDKVSIGLFWKPSDRDQGISFAKHRGYTLIVWTYSFTFITSLEQNKTLFLHLHSLWDHQITLLPKEKIEEWHQILEEPIVDFTPYSLMMAHFPNNWYIKH